MGFVTKENREEWGLPGRSWSRRPARLWGALAAVLLFSAAGLVGGTLYRQWLTRQVALAYEDFSSQTRPALLRGAMKRLQQSAAPVIEAENMRLVLAQAYLRCAELLPQRSMYLQSALREIERALEKNGVQHDAEVILFRAGTLAETGNDRAARIAYDRAATVAAGNFHPLTRAQWLNGKGYLLAVSSDPSVRDPREALRLAEEAVSIETVDHEGKSPSQMPAFIDTLASAAFACGDAKRALRLQTLAISLLQDGNLSDYLHHYDEYADACQQTSSTLGEQP